MYNLRSFKKILKLKSKILKMISMTRPSTCTQSLRIIETFDFKRNV